MSEQNEAKKSASKKIKKKTKLAQGNLNDTKKTREIVSIKDVSADELFGKNSIWSATNLKTQIEFELSGFNVGLYLSADEPLRHLLLTGHIDSFTREGLYIKFLKCETDVN